MKNKIALVLFCLFAVAFIGCSNICDCGKISNSSTYDEAVSKAKDCGASDSKSTSNSSWIRKISFYECEGTTGFVIIQTDKDEYIHSNVPKTIWANFKEADSFGEFYNQNLKGKFRFSLKK